MCPDTPVLPTNTYSAIDNAFLSTCVGDAIVNGLERLWSYIQNRMLHCTSYASSMLTAFPTTNEQIGQCSMHGRYVSQRSPEPQTKTRIESINFQTDCTGTDAKPACNHIPKIVKLARDTMVYTMKKLPRTSTMYDAMALHQHAWTFYVTTFDPGTSCMRDASDVSFYEVAYTPNMISQFVATHASDVSVETDAVFKPVRQYSLHSTVLVATSRRIDVSELSGMSTLASEALELFRGLFRPLDVDTTLESLRQALRGNFQNALEQGSELQLVLGRLKAAMDGAKTVIESLGRSFTTETPKLLKQAHERVGEVQKYAQQMKSLIGQAAVEVSPRIVALGEIVEMLIAKSKQLVALFGRAIGVETASLLACVAVTEILAPLCIHAATLIDVSITAYYTVDIIKSMVDAYRAFHLSPLPPPLPSPPPPPPVALAPLVVNPVGFRKVNMPCIQHADCKTGFCGLISLTHHCPRASAKVCCSALDAVTGTCVRQELGFCASDAQCASGHRCLQTYPYYYQRTSDAPLLQHDLDLVALDESTFSGFGKNACGVCIPETHKFVNNHRCNTDDQCASGHCGRIASAHTDGTQRSNVCERYAYPFSTSRRLNPSTDWHALKPVNAETRYATGQRVCCPSVKNGRCNEQGSNLFCTDSTQCAGKRMVCVFDGVFPTQRYGMLHKDYFLPPAEGVAAGCGVCMLYHNENLRRLSERDDAASGDFEAGDAGSGDAGSGGFQAGDAGSGDAGSGDAGTGDAGSGDAGTGNASAMCLIGLTLQMWSVHAVRTVVEVRGTGLMAGRACRSPSSDCVMLDTAIDAVVKLCNDVETLRFEAFTSFDALGTSVAHGDAMIHVYNATATLFVGALSGTADDVSVVHATVNAGPYLAHPSRTLLRGSVFDGSDAHVGTPCRDECSNDGACPKVCGYAAACCGAPNASNACVGAPESDVARCVATATGPRYVFFRRSQRKAYLQRSGAMVSALPLDSACVARLGVHCVDAERNHRAGDVVPVAQAYFGGPLVDAVLVPLDPDPATFAPVVPIGHSCERGFLGTTRLRWALQHASGTIDLLRDANETAYEWRELLAAYDVYAFADEVNGVARPSHDTIDASTPYSASDYLPRVGEFLLRFFDRIVVQDVVFYVRRCAADDIDVALVSPQYSAPSDARVTRHLGIARIPSDAVRAGTCKVLENGREQSCLDGESRAYTCSGGAQTVLNGTFAEDAQPYATAGCLQPGCVAVVGSDAAQQRNAKHTLLARQYNPQMYTTDASYTCDVSGEKVRTHLVEDKTFEHFVRVPRGAKVTSYAFRRFDRSTACDNAGTRCYAHGVSRRGAAFWRPIVANATLQSLGALLPQEGGLTLAAPQGSVDADAFSEGPTARAHHAVRHAHPVCRGSTLVASARDPYSRLAVQLLSQGLVTTARGTHARWRPVEVDARALGLSRSMRADAVVNVTYVACPGAYSVIEEDDDTVPLASATTMLYQLDTFRSQQPADTLPPTMPRRLVRRLSATSSAAASDSLGREWSDDATGDGMLDGMTISVSERQRLRACMDDDTHGADACAVERRHTTCGFHGGQTPVFVPRNSVDAYFFEECAQGACELDPQCTAPDPAPYHPWGDFASCHAWLLARGEACSTASALCGEAVACA